jgi:hypothetical protein
MVSPICGSPHYERHLEEGLFFQNNYSALLKNKGEHPIHHYYTPISLNSPLMEIFSIFMLETGGTIVIIGFVVAIQ